MKRLLKGVLLALGGLVAIFVVGAVVLYFQYERGLYVPSDEPAPEIVIHGGMLFDGMSTSPIPKPGIIVGDGRIACLGTDCVPGADRWVSRYLSPPFSRGIPVLAESPR